MNKILLIIQREYLSRVKKKSFIVLTILVPVLVIGMMALIAFISVKQNELGDKKKIEVVDESGRFSGKMKGSSTMEYVGSKENYEVAKNNFIKNGYDYLLYIPASLTGIQVLGEKKAGPMTSGKIEDELSNILRSQRLAEAGIDSAMLAKAQKPISVASMQVTENGIKDAHAWVAYGVGVLSALLIYMCLLIYGTQVMRGVIEEKVSRIIEVIISSVKPFQLMLGKIIGVGMVGLTQFILWIVISIALYTLAGPALMKTGMNTKTEQVSQIQHSAGQGQATAESVPPDTEINSVMHDIAGIPVAYTILCFLFYFLSGYLLYSAIFAAVGSAVDNETETQQFVLPVTLPLIFTFALAQSFIINNPDSTLSVWLSMIPFTSPIAMMIRIPFGVPAWQLALSMFLMVVGFLFTTWVASRIYRVGILMYGKKASYKELARWFMYKE
ncbi:MAG: ABC transporter permease [Chitinophagales bacterium]